MTLNSTVKFCGPVGQFHKALIRTFHHMAATFVVPFSPNVSKLFFIPTFLHNLGQIYYQRKEEST